MHILCKIFGHKVTKTIASKSFIFADNYWCDRCKIWSYDKSEIYYGKWCNGLLPEIKGRIRGYVYLPIRGYIGYFIYKIAFWRKPPF